MDFDRLVNAAVDIVWSPALVGLLIFAGLYFTFRSRFVQLRRFGLMVRSLFSTEGRTGHGISSFQAFCVALSGRVGTGNIIGVATAIALGGPGAVFWMWVIAFFGAATAFVESTLAQKYRFHHRSGWRGGPALYIEEALGQRWLGILFALLTVVGYGLFLSTVQSNGVATALQNSFRLDPLWSGLTLAFLLALVVIGGIKSIARAATVLTPFMAVGYLLVTALVLWRHADAIPGVFRLIFEGAFGQDAALGGILGSTIMMGVKRGIFSNEAGQGGGAIVSASADVPHPARQGLAQAFSVYVDTLLICTATALMILCSGCYNVFDAQGAMIAAHAPGLGSNYVGFTQAAVDSVLHGFGGPFVSIALVFFVFTTLMAYYFYCESSVLYLFRRKAENSVGERLVLWVFRILMLAAVVFGALREAGIIWKLGDVGVGLTAWINVLSLLILCPAAFRELRNYEQSVREKRIFVRK